MAAHHKLAPSSASRWMRCTASVAAIERDQHAIERDEEYSNEGTVAHHYAAELLLGNKPEIEDRIMREAVEDYADYVMGLLQDFSQTYVEQKLELAATGGFGTSDYIVLNGTHLHVVDLKYGAGERVYAKDNEQGLLYASGAVDLVYPADIEKVTIHICQPRLGHFDSWTLTIAELREFLSRVADAVADIEAGNVKYEPGRKQCRFCPRAPRCTALANDMFKALTNDVEKIKFLDPDEMNIGEVAAVYKNLDTFRVWINAVESHISAALHENKPVPGFKLVEGRSSRTWGDPELALEYLFSALPEDQSPYTEPKVLSPAAVEAEIGKSAFRELGLDDLVTKPRGNPVIASEDDPRPGYFDDDADLFEDLDDNSENVK